MPLGVQKPIVDKLHDAIVKVASDPEFQKRHMTARGLSAALNSPEEFAKEIETDIELGRDVVKASGLYPDVK
jgi:tripartite-type tricarboxylate transporter receptor subunit TctC